MNFTRRGKCLARAGQTCAEHFTLHGRSSCAPQPACDKIKMTNTPGIKNTNDKEYLLHIPAQPDSREVSPSQLPNNMIPAIEKVSNFHWMIATFYFKKNNNFRKIVIEYHLFLCQFLIPLKKAVNNKIRLKYV